MHIKQLIHTYAQDLTDHYGRQLLPGHRKALDAMLACRSQCGEFTARCSPCSQHCVVPLSCGHRNCPHCQQHLGNAWLERQQQKLLPVTYFMVTLTLPSQLRDIAWQHQSIVYECLFQAAIETLQTVGKNNFKLQFGMTGVLHTHKRDKDYHPHIHLVLPGGGLTLDGQTWQSLPQDFIINEFALARIFRGILLRKLFEQAIALPNGLPKQWVANIRKVGRGEKALKYLSRYLYRGVISENDILADHDGQVTFRYQDSESRQMKTRALPAAAFLWRLLKHVLPRGFRRVRDVGFMHGNAKKMLRRIQLLLHVKLPTERAAKKRMTCSICKAPMQIDLVVPKKIPMQFRFYPSAIRQSEAPLVPS